jgi:hypothetical protein
MGRINIVELGIGLVSVVRLLSFRIFIYLKLFLLISAHFVEIKGVESKPSCDVAPARTEAMLGIPEKDRSCKVLLTEGKLRPSSLWRWSTLNRSRAPYPSVKDFVSYVWIRRSFEILQYQMKFLSPVSDNERRFAVTSMASARLNLPNDADALKKFRDEMAGREQRRQKRAKRRQVEGGRFSDLLSMYTLPLLSSPQQRRSKKEARRLDKGKRVESTPRKPTSASAF